MSEILYDIKVVHPLSPAPNSIHSSSTGSLISPLSSMPPSPPLPSLDEVTTIFVVGFPDDMQEREFQNMFMFSKGFEAASLKWHSKDQQEEQDTVNMMNKKQMIGFARFKTRSSAIEAVKEMNGKKVDVEKGCILKAEMAKKNLHIKRNSIIPTTSVLPSAVPLPEPMMTTHSTSSHTTSSSMTSSTTIVLNTNTSTHSSSNVTTPTDLPMSDLVSRLGQINLKKNQPIETSFIPTQPNRYESFSPLPSDLLSPGECQMDPFLNDTFLIASNISSFDPSLFGTRSQSFDSRFGGPFLKHTDIQPLNPIFSKSNTIPSSSDYEADHISPLDLKGEGFFSFHHPRQSEMMSRKHSLQSSRIIPSSSPPNPADQNPPCNTLYVGNLPPSTSEEELKSLFIPCEGYKRMCFRQKPQGPMCFVEFDDIVYATQAMHELQSHILSNSIKGGIRLSYSKNPLFIKPNKEAEISLGFKQLGTALLADN